MKVQLIRLALAIVLMAFGVWGAIVLDGGLQVLSGFWAFFMGLIVFFGLAELSD
jgi:hypothetical protein